MFSHTLLNPLNQACCRVALYQRDCFNGTAVGQHKIGPYNSGYRVIVAFDKNMGTNGLNQFFGGWLIKQNHKVDKRHSGHHARTGVLIYHRAQGALDPAHRSIGIEPQHEPIAERAGFFEVINMTQMNNIEAAIGKHHALPTGPPLGGLLNSLGKGKDFGGRQFSGVNQLTDGVGIPVYVPNGNYFNLVIDSIGY